ncbi:FeoA family protein [Proteinivorax hydrogeniformans]|uniref:FeoA family protein n=1 Tax=Proteinivorax hydrogeniformans TaxID=1826727 RepID=A0AAU8HW38_9FIRM
MRLTQVKAGQRAIIKRINDNKYRGQITRFGLLEGVQILCIKNIKKGPVIVNLNNFHLAIGQQLANQIVVRRESYEKAEASFSWKPQRR